MNDKLASYDEYIPVVIVGGSVVGLSTALFLAWHGIPCLLLERHTDTSLHARAGSFNARTMELFRQIGIESAIFQRETPAEQRGEMGLRVESLAGKVLVANEMIINQQYQPMDPFASPTRGALIGQDKLEPILHACARAWGCASHFGTEMLAFAQDAEGVVVHTRHCATGQERRIRASYLVAADGNRSAIRQQLGIASYGYGTLGHWMSIVFRTDLSELLRGRKITLCFVNNATIEGIMGQLEDRWALLANIKPQQGERPDVLSEQRCLELVRAAIGIPEQPVEIVSTHYWELAARVAEHYQYGRVLLAGDAAHVMTTMGAFGANTGIADAHNLAWKLAYVLNESAGPALLNTYTTERQAAADLAVAVSAGLYAYRLPNHEHREAIMHSAAEILARVRRDPDVPQPTGFSVVQGYRYRSAAIISEGEDDGVFYENEPSGRPGTRAPHLWLKYGAKQLSTLDLYGRNFVLLTGSAPNNWRDAIAEVQAKLGIQLDVYAIGQGEAYVDNEHTFLTTYAITRSGAVLIRPDGFIAWRTSEFEAHSAVVLEQVLTHILCR